MSSKRGLYEFISQLLDNCIRISLDCLYATHIKGQYWVPVQQQISCFYFGKMEYNRWKKIKRSGGFRRKVNKVYTRLKQSTSALAAVTMGVEQSNNISAGSVGNIHASADYEICEPTNSSKVCSRSGNICADQASDSDSNISEYINSSDNDNDRLESENNDSSESEDNENINDEFRSNFKEWALQFNISHDALRKLSTILNKIIPYLLPKDPRTILETNTSKIDIFSVNCGLYWHKGLTEPLQKCLEAIDCNSDVINLLVNIDGLPVYNSSKLQFWPILCKILEIPTLSPQVVGIYAGQVKPSDIDKYLEHFVNEMKDLENGLRIKTKM